MRGKYYTDRYRLRGEVQHVEEIGEESRELLVGTQVRLSSLLPRRSVVAAGVKRASGDNRPGFAALRTRLRHRRRRRRCRRRDHDGLLYMLNVHLSGLGSARLGGPYRSPARFCGSFASGALPPAAEAGGRHAPARAEPRDGDSEWVDARLLGMGR